jgi:hypothetical protein
MVRETSIITIQNAVKSRKSVVLYGPRGVGKTWTFEQVRKKTKIWLIDVDLTMFAPTLRITKNVIPSDVDPSRGIKVLFYDNVDDAPAGYSSGIFGDVKKQINRFSCIITCHSKTCVPATIRKSCVLVELKPLDPSVGIGIYRERFGAGIPLNIRMPKEAYKNLHFLLRDRRLTINTSDVTCMYDSDDEISTDSIADKIPYLPNPFLENGSTFALDVIDVLSETNAVPGSFSYVSQSLNRLVQRNTQKAKMRGGCLYKKKAISKTDIRKRLQNSKEQFEAYNRKRIEAKLPRLSVIDFYSNREFLDKNG